MEGEQVNIIPKITDPDMMRRAAAAPQKVEQGGIFTSLYDNKIIALCIVVAIIIIAVCAYVFFKRDAGPSTIPAPMAAHLGAVAQPTVAAPSTATSPTTVMAPATNAATSAVTINTAPPPPNTAPTGTDNVSVDELLKAREQLQNRAKSAPKNDFDEVLENTVPEDK